MDQQAAGTRFGGRVRPSAMALRRRRGGARLALRLLVGAAFLAAAAVVVAGRRQELLGAGSLIGQVRPLWLAMAVAAEALSAAIDRVLTDEEMRASSALHRSRLRTTDPPARAADLLEQLL